MAKQMIADRITVERRYVRAADIARDLPDPNALDGYVLTSRASEAMLRLAKGLCGQSTQRAFRVTGPYGSGKSSFGLLLAKLCGGTDERANTLSSRALEDKHFPIFVPMVLVGRRTSMARELLVSIGKTARAHFGESDKQGKRCDDLLNAATNGKRIETDEVLDELAGLSARLKESVGAGLLVLVDEMGRFLEFAASNQATEDPALFQQLAERASGSQNLNLSVVAFLHHRFDDYLASNDDWSSKNVRAALNAMKKSPLPSRGSNPCISSRKR